MHISFLTRVIEQFSEMFYRSLSIYYTNHRKLLNYVFVLIPEYGWH